MQKNTWLKHITPHHWLAGILTLSVIARLAVAFYLGAQVVELPGTADQVSYHTLAGRVLSGEGFSFGQPWWPLTAAGAPTAHWSYLYTGFLAGVYTLFGGNPLAARLIQALLVGLAQPTLTYLLGRRAFGVSAGLWAAGASAVYTYFIYYAGALMTEPFYITAVLGGLYLTIRLADQLAQGEGSTRRIVGYAAGLGLTVGLAVLLRQLFLFFLPFLFAWLWLALPAPRPNRRLALSLAIVVAILLALILPFTWYNYQRFDRFVLLNTNAGFAFFWANHPVYGTRFQPILPPELGTYLDLVPPDLRALDEAALDQALLKRGLQFVRDDPLRYLQLSLSRIPVYFMFWPSRASGLISNLSRAGGFGLFLPFMLAGLWLALRRLWVEVRGQRLAFTQSTGAFLASPVCLLVLFAGIYSGIHILSWALVRYRLPVDAVMLVFGGLALHTLFNWLIQLQGSRR